MSQTTQNYRSPGGEEWVIGGKLTILPGAVVEGLPGAVVLPCVKPSEATTVAQLREDFNRLLAALKASGLMAAE